MANNSSLSSSSYSTGKNTTIILPGDKKPKIIGCGKKTEIKADVDVLKLIHKNRDELNAILDLSKNNLKSLPKNFGAMQSLKVLDLLGNQLTNLPSSFCELKSLQVN